MSFRIEEDSFGSLEVPSDRLWGAQTQRSIQNFQIGLPGSMPLEVIRGVVLVKKASAMVNADLGVIESEKSLLITKVCDEILQGVHDKEFPLVVWQTGSGTHTNMNVNEVIANRAIQISQDSSIHIHPNDDVNKSQSSNDTFPTAMHIACYTKLVEYTIPAIELLIETFDKKAKLFSSVIKVGRTHLMDATPLTFGQELSSFVVQLQNALKLIKSSLDHLSELALGGTAVGTGINAPKGYAVKTAECIALLTGHPFKTAPNKFEALSAHDAVVVAHSSLKQLVVVLHKIANDIRFLASGPRCGIGEVFIPENEPGSSIMPGKVNPTQCEAVLMVCAQVFGNDLTISQAGAGGQCQLNAYKPVMVYNFLQSAGLIGDACTSFARNCIDGMMPNESKMRFYLKESLMLATVLNTKIGYHKASEVVQKAHKEQITLRESALTLNYLTEEEFDEWMDPLHMI